MDGFNVSLASCLKNVEGCCTESSGWEESDFKATGLESDSDSCKTCNLQEKNEVHIKNQNRKNNNFMKIIAEVENCNFSWFFRKMLKRDLEPHELYHVKHASSGTLPFMP